MKYKLAIIAAGLAVGLLGLAISLIQYLNLIR